MHINLLPKSEKSRVKKLYNQRRLVIVMWFVITVFFVSNLMLIPMYLLSENISFLAEQRVHQLDDELDFSTEEVEDQVFTLNKKASVLLNSEYTATYPLIKDITQSKPVGISVTGMLFQVTEEGDRLQIVGTSLNRERLLEFRRDLEQKAYIESVDLPVSNFAQQTNIEFTIFLVLRAPEKDTTEETL